VVRPTRRPAGWHEVQGAGAIARMGFGEHEALLAPGLRHFSGYRLLQEYFALPGRFMFVELSGLQRAVRRASETELDVIVLFRRLVPALENAVDRSGFALYCTPVINLFPRRADRIHVAPGEHEYHVVPDRTKPMDFEVVQVLEIEGLAEGGGTVARFLPFYSCSDPDRWGEQRAYFTVRRTPRLMSERQRAQGARSSYLGSEVFVALVDAHEAPHPPDLRQIAVTTLCTNRDLPLHLPLGGPRTDFTMIAGAPVRSVRCLGGPTAPRPAPPTGETPWRLISHLAPNYLSLTDTDARQGAAALRAMLALYGAFGDAAVVQKQVEGVRSVSCRPVLRQVGRGLTASFARGLEITLTLDEGAFKGLSVFLLGSVLEEFFARYVSINSFTETVLHTVDRGEVMRWPPRIGRRPIA
jgi:type VI secretion system protein ImpG